MVGSRRYLGMRESILLFIIACVLLSLIIYSIWFFMKTYKSIEECNENFTFFIPITITLGGMLIILSQYLSILIVNKAAKIWRPKKCKYCNSRVSKLVCSECDSIQWDLKSGNTVPSIAVFFAHHRWKVISSIFTFFLIGPLFYAFQVHSTSIDKLTLGKKDEVTRERDRSNKLNNEILNIISYSNDLRPKLRHLEYVAKNKLIKNDQLNEISKQLIKSYFDYAWELAKITDAIKLDTSKSSDTLAFELLTESDLIPKLDTTFFNVIDELMKIKNPGNKSDNLVNKIKLFDSISKGVSCGIGVISFNPTEERKKKEIITGCDSIMIKALSLFQIKNNK